MDVAEQSLSTLLRYICSLIAPNLVLAYRDGHDRAISEMSSVDQKTQAGRRAASVPRGHVSYALQFGGSTADSRVNVKVKIKDLQVMERDTSSELDVSEQAQARAYPTDAKER